MKSKIETSQEFKLIGKWTDKNENYGTSGENIALFNIENAIDKTERDNPGIVELEYELRNTLRELIESDIEPKGLGEIRKTVCSIGINFLYSRAIVYYHTQLHFNDNDR